MGFLMGKVYGATNWLYTLRFYGRQYLGGVFCSILWFNLTKYLLIESYKTTMHVHGAFAPANQIRT
jgi:hypothetical protein